MHVGSKSYDEYIGIPPRAFSMFNYKGFTLKKTPTDLVLGKTVSQRSSETLYCRKHKGSN